MKYYTGIIEGVAAYKMPPERAHRYLSVALSYEYEYRNTSLARYDIRYQDTDIGYMWVSCESDDITVIDHFEIYSTFRRKGFGTDILTYFLAENHIFMVYPNILGKSFFIKTGFVYIKDEYGGYYVKEL